MGIYRVHREKKFELPYEIQDGKIIFKNMDLLNGRVLPNIGSGSKSDVYKIRIGGKFYALKVFNDLYNPDIENFKRKQKLDISSYVTPQLLGFYKDKFCSYLMEFCPGGDLEKRKLDLPISEFINSYQALENDTDKLSEEGYNIFDTFISNVMYFNGFKMIDTDEYPYHESHDSESLEQIKVVNRRRLNQTISNIFINSTGLGLLFFSNVEFTKLKSYCESGKMSFMDFFNLIYNKALSYGEEMENISDIGKVLTKKM